MDIHFQHQLRNDLRWKATTSAERNELRKFNWTSLCTIGLPALVYPTAWLYNQIARLFARTFGLSLPRQAVKIAIGGG